MSSHKDNYIQISAIREYVINGKKEFADVIKVIDFNVVGS